MYKPYLIKIFPALLEMNHVDIWTDKMSPICIQFVQTTYKPKAKNLIDNNKAANKHSTVSTVLQILGHKSRLYEFSVHLKYVSNFSLHHIKESKKCLNMYTEINTQITVLQLVSYGTFQWYLIN
jgi:hypothetical protein